MERRPDWLIDKSDESELHGVSKQRKRRRPMSRAQEIALMAIAFAIGAGLQVAYVFNGAPSP